VAVKSSRDISAELVRGQKIEEHVVTDVDLRYDDNRPSLTSSAAAEECQDVSSKNTGKTKCGAPRRLWKIWPLIGDSPARLP